MLKVTGSMNTFARHRRSQSSQDLFMINTLRMESYHGHHISSEDRLFMSQPPSVQPQPQGTFVLTVQAGQVIKNSINHYNHYHYHFIINIIRNFLQVISYKVDNTRQVENLTNALMGMNMEVKIIIIFNSIEV